VVAYLRFLSLVKIQNPNLMFYILKYKYNFTNALNVIPVGRHPAALAPRGSGLEYILRTLMRVAKRD
jgi:hypothetical protein